MTLPPSIAGRFPFPLFPLLAGTEQLPAEPSVQAALTGGGIEAAEARTIRLDSLFDVFFESYWARCAGLVRVALTGISTGGGRIEINRRDANSGEERRVASVSLDGTEGPFEIPITLSPPTNDDDSTYLIPVIHLEPGTELRGLCWSADIAPKREVRLAGVICSFGREDMLTRNLAAFAESPAFLSHLVVVNQGKPGLAERVKPHILSGLPTTFIDQANFGGAGGFTRGIIESLTDPDTTHILLMDDDIDAQPLLLARMATVLSYIGERDCIGGAMLDMVAPNRLFTCGDVLHQTRPRIMNMSPEANEDDITTDEGRDFIARWRCPDFNGWWCFAFPVAAVRQCGLPLPLFIRGDDVEFGVRLTKAGFPTVSWPGIAVWHMPFHSKGKPWHGYYDQRNLLFLHEMHGWLSRKRMTRSAWGSFLNAIVTYDYARATAIIEGVAAFNKGAKHLADWSGPDHEALLRRMADHRLNGPKENNLSPVLLEDGKRRHPSIVPWRFLKDLLLPFGRSRKVHAAVQNQWHPRIYYRPARLSLRQDDGGSDIYLCYNWFSAVKLTARAIPAMFRLRWLRRPNSRAVRQLVQPDFWQAYLVFDRDDGRSFNDRGFANRTDNGIANANR